VTSQTTIPVGIYWKPGVWDLARSAYVADLDTDPESPGAFVGWLARALELHARRSPQQRVELAAAAGQHPAQVSTRKSFNKKHDLPASTIEAVEDAVVADRQELGRVLARSAFAQEAVIAAADEARRRLGRDLPPPPQKLSNRPPRRRPARQGLTEPAALAT
jgi:signal transduction histidine kinase